MGGLGFSYIGIIFLLMLIVPNLIWTRNQPKGYDFQNENKILLILERMGQVCVTCTALVFSDLDIKKWSLWMLWLIAAFLFMVLYEIWWTRYFKSEKNLKDFYSTFFGIPVAGATLPVIAFFLLSIYGKSVLLMVSVIILGIGHIGIHLQHRKEAERQN